MIRLTIRGMNGLSDAQFEELKHDLAHLLVELDGLLDLTEEGARPIELDQPIGRLSRMDAMQQREMAMANRDAHRARKRLVEEAIEAVDDGSYGLCVTCDRPIPWARLKALPEAPTCLTCQEKRDA